MFQSQQQLREIARVIATKVLEKLMQMYMMVVCGCYVMVVLGFTKKKILKEFGKVLEMMKKHEVPITLGMYNILIQILCKLKKTIVARALLNGLISINVKPNSITYNPLIHGYCNEGKLVILKRSMFDPFDTCKKMNNIKSYVRRVFVYYERLHRVDAEISWSLGECCGFL